MAKKTRKKSAAKAAKTRKKTAKRKNAVARKSRKVAARKKSKPVASKTLIAKERAAPKTIRKPPPGGLLHEVEEIVTEVGDIFSDAEQLHQRLDPGISREPE
jgi:hypothetical protein